MKVISKEDLIILIPLISDCNSYSLDDFELLLNKFGDDYFIEGNRFERTTENAEMARIRKEAKRSNKNDAFI